MPPKRKSRKKRDVSKGRATHPRLPGYLMITFGLLGIFINFDLISGLEWAKAYPLAFILLGFVAVVKTFIARD